MPTRGRRASLCRVSVEDIEQQIVAFARKSSNRSTGLETNPPSPSRTSKRRSAPGYPRPERRHRPGPHTSCGDPIGFCGLLTFLDSGRPAVRGGQKGRLRMAAFMPGLSVGALSAGARRIKRLALRLSATVGFVGQGWLVFVQRFVQSSMGKRSPFQMHQSPSLACISTKTFHR